MSELTKLTLIEALEGLKNKKFSSLELTEAFIKNIEKNKNLNAYITETFDIARENAKKSDEKIKNGKAGKLEGIPMGIKDIFCTKGVKTTAASKMLENFVPPYESTVTQKLSDEGYVLLGKTNTDEFACGSTTTTSYFGPSINPYRNKNDDRDLVPGGSSGGSATAVAADLCIAATGTDTGSSIREPSAFCNLVGLKPTYGRVSRYGIVSFASSFDQAGIISKTVKDNAYLTELICGFDTKDSTSADKEVPHFYNNLNENIKGKKIGLVKEFLELQGINPQIEKVFNKNIENLKNLGVEIIEVSLPYLKYSSNLYTVIAYTELASNLARFDGVRFTHRTSEAVKNLDELYMKSRGEGFGKKVKRRIMLGYHTSSSENFSKFFIKAQKIRRLIINDFVEVFKKVDLLVSPTLPFLPFPIDLTKEEEENLIIPGLSRDILMIPANIAGLPAMSVPMGLSEEGLPMGLQIMGNYFDEQSIFDLGLVIEKTNAK